MLGLILSLAIAFSFLGLIALEKNSAVNFNPIKPFTPNLSANEQSMFWAAPASILCLPASSVQSTFLDVAKEASFALVGNSTRAQVYSFIVANPGVQFRGICAGLGIAVGTAEFHLGVLKKAGLISFIRDGKYKRFFASKRFSQQEMKLISILRHQTAREILKTIVNQKSVSHCSLAAKLSITSQGLTWQMNRLREEKVVQESYDGIKVTYSLNEAYLQTLPQLLCIIEP